MHCNLAWRGIRGKWCLVLRSLRGCPGVTGLDGGLCKVSCGTVGACRQGGVSYQALHRCTGQPRAANVQQPWGERWSSLLSEWDPLMGSRPGVDLPPLLEGDRRRGSCHLGCRPGPTLQLPPPPPSTAAWLVAAPSFPFLTLGSPLLLSITFPTLQSGVAFKKTQTLLLKILQPPPITPW